MSGRGLRGCTKFTSSLPTIWKRELAAHSSRTRSSSLPPPSKLQMLITISSSLTLNPISLQRWNFRSSRLPLRPRRAIRFVPCGTSSQSPSSSSPMNEEPVPLDYDPSRDLLGLDVEPQPRNLISDAEKLRSWFGPNGQYIRELPCPSCRGRGYTPCTECGIERSRVDCSECNGKGLKTCQQCSGDRVIWEESIDERPWEKARSSSPFKVKEDDEVDNLEIKVDVTRRSKRVYQSPSPEVGLKISRSLRILNAKTGLFSNRMKILHRDPTLHAQRVAAIKKTKGTVAARKQASETMKAFFHNPENRFKRSIVMKGVKFHCSYCGEEGHRRHYCPSLKTASETRRFRCRLCGERGHNRRTCGKTSEEVSKRSNNTRNYRCKVCAQNGHNRRTCPQLIVVEVNGSNTNDYSLAGSSECKRIYSCSFCLKRGHNIRTCPDKKAETETSMNDPHG